MRGSEEIADRLRKHLDAARPEGVVSAYLFGSQAGGRAHRESDVDVGVLFDYDALPSRADRSRRAVALGAELVGALHRNEVDVVALNDAPPELAAAVVRAGHRVYVAGESADRAFARTTVLLYADIKPFLERTRRLKLQALGR